MKKMARIERGKAYRRGGIWYDPMCFPERRATIDQ